jgi:hypothetical protein
MMLQHEINGFMPGGAPDSQLPKLIRPYLGREVPTRFFYGSGNLNVK